MMPSRYIPFGTSFDTDKMHRLFVYVSGIAIAAGFSRTLEAQTVDATIVGTVRDSAGMPLSNIAVTALNNATGLTWTIHSSAGRFAFIQLPLGEPYTVSTKQIGFAPETREGYALSLSTRTLEFFQRQEIRTQFNCH